MRPRTRILICVGLLTAVGVALALRSPAKPEFEGRFVRYEQDGSALLAFTNRGRSTIGIGSPMFIQGPGLDYASAPINLRTLPPGQSMEVLVARAFPPGSAPVPIAPSMTVSVVYAPNHSQLRGNIELLLSSIGIQITRSSFATVTLPPSGSNAPAQPVTP